MRRTLYISWCLLIAGVYGLHTVALPLVDSRYSPLQTVDWAILSVGLAVIIAALFSVIKSAALYVFACLVFVLTILEILDLGSYLKEASPYSIRDGLLILSSIVPGCTIIVVAVAFKKWWDFDREIGGNVAGEFS